MSGGTRAPADPLVGRKRELDELRRGLEEVRTGYGRIFLVDGEPGIGKTRLAEELARIAATLGMKTLWGSCWEGEKAPALWPWGQILRACLRDFSDTGSERIGTRRHVARLLAERPDRPLASVLGSESADEPFELFAEVVTIFRSLADGAPLLLILDDLQWADRSSLRLLQFVSREIRLSRIGVLGTYREPDLRSSPDRATVLSAVLRSGQHLSLGGLSLVETGELIGLLRGEAPAPSFVVAVYEATGGSPFFARELARLHGAERSRRLPIPPGVRATIRERLAGLPPECREALEAASVVGQEFEAGVLEAVLDAPPMSMLERLAVAARSAIVSEVGSAPDRFHFAHALIRETLYEDLTPAERARIHGRAGKAIERLHGANLVPHLDALAHHYEQAGLTAEAARWRERAGLRAFEVSAYEEAVGHFERALALAELEEPSDGIRRARLLFSLGQARKAAGDYRGGNSDLERAAEAARRAGDPVLLALTALEYAGYQRRIDRIDAAHVERLEAALAALGDGEPALEARLRARLAFHRFLPGADERASREPLELARRIGDPLAIGEALFTRWFHVGGPDARKEQEEIRAEMLEVAERNSLGLLEWQARMAGAWTRMDAGDIAGLRIEIEALGRRVRRPVNRVNLLFLRSVLAYLEGRFDEAEMLAREGDELARKFDHTMRGLVEFGVIELRKMQGRLAEAEPRLASLGRFLHWKCCVTASVCAGLGRLEGARRELDALGDLTRLPKDLRWLANLCDLVEVCVTLNDHDRMRTLLELLLPYADQLAPGYVSLSYRGSVATYIGILEGALGRRDEARRHLVAGVARDERVGVPQATALSRVALAELLAADGEGARATALLEAALATARELGMRGLEERAATLLSRLGREQPAAGGALLRNEGDYWTIAYGGRTVRMKDSKGLRDIALLLSSPGRDIHVADLIAREALADAPAPAEPPGAREIAEAGLTVSREGSAGPKLDARARGEYRARLDELREELGEAEKANDLGRAEKARRELDFLAGELASAYGLGGRARASGDPSERARKAVGARIRYTASRIRSAHAALGSHLERSLKTGTFCSYASDEPVQWTVKHADEP